MLVVLALFTWWGARRGAIRQMLSLGVVLGGLALAGHLAPRLVPTVNKLASLEPGPALAAAWAAALFGALVLGALLLRALSSRLPPARGGAANRWIGALLGLAKGLVVGVVVGYAVLASSGGAPTPALSRPDVAPERPTPTAGLAGRLRGSVSAEGLAEGASLLGRWFRVPDWIRFQVEAVNASLDVAPDAHGAGRPRER
jgi:membrane protein required for colicin V production